MLLSLRDNLKGTVAITIIFLFFIMPMILTGIGGGSSFLGSVAGNSAADVDGRSVSNSELRRAIYMRKQQLLSQSGVDPTADYLKDENLRKPVLESLTRRAAILVANEKAGMGVSDVYVDEQIQNQEQFFVDDKFDNKRFRELVGNAGYTPATFMATVAEDGILQQYAVGLQESGFVTPFELEALVALVEQKRSFSVVKVPANSVGDDITIDESEIKTYYDNNQSEFIEPEKISVSYVELSVEAIKDEVEIVEEDVRAAYEAELESFDSTPEYEVSHILIEHAEDDTHAAKLAELQNKLTGDDISFADLAKEYSDDAGSKEIGGELGIFIAGTYPEAFEAALLNLEEGGISGPVETDSGTHFIKANSKSVPQAPSFEDRKSNLSSDLKQAQAEDLYAERIETLKEMVLDAPDLEEAAAALGVNVEVSSLFSRNRGADSISFNDKVRKAAFSDDVQVEGYNSDVIELQNNKAVVVRKGESKPEHVKSLELVASEIKSKLVGEKKNTLLAEKANDALNAMKSSDDVKAYAEAASYEFNDYVKAKRSDIAIDSSLLRAVFALPKVTDENSIYEVVSGQPDGSHYAIKLYDVVTGSKDDMPEQQVAGLTTQIRRESTSSESSAYETYIVDSAEVTVH